jgi:hypothetical protein
MPCGNSGHDIGSENREGMEWKDKNWQRTNRSGINEFPLPIYKSCPFQGHRIPFILFLFHWLALSTCPFRAFPNHWPFLPSSLLFNPEDGISELLRNVGISAKLCGLDWHSSNPLNSYTVDARFESQQGHRVLWLEFLVICFSHSTKIVPRLGHDCFITNPFQFTVRHPSSQPYVVSLPRAW